MSHLHLGTTALSIVLTVGAILGYGAFVLYGAWIDGRRQSVRNKGKHPVTDANGEVHAREEENGNGSKRR
jgi:hypothetical protein